MIMDFLSLGFNGKVLEISPSLSLLSYFLLMDSLHGVFSPTITCALIIAILIVRNIKSRSSFLYL